MMSEDLNMESHLKTQNQKPPAGKKGFVVLIAFFRLGLLLGPEALAVKFLGHSPIICAFACLFVLALWFSVDVWPFRPAAAPAPAPVKRVEAPFVRNFTKAQWWSYLFCRIVVFFALFHSKLSI
jgi:hypothetical protein